MPLPFPNETFKLSLRARQASSIFGTITLATTSHTQVTIYLENGDTATKDVDYSSSHGNCGYIAPFTIVLGAATWQVDGVSVSKSGQAHYLTSDTVTIGGNLFSLSGISEDGKAPPARHLTVALRTTRIGELDFFHHLGLPVSFFTPANGGLRFADVDNELITWRNGQTTFSGRRFVYGGSHPTNCVTIGQGYFGLSTQDQFGHESEEEWEASGRTGGGRITGFTAAPSLPFPTGVFRIVAFERPSTASGTLTPPAMSGTMLLSLVDGRPSVTILSGSASGSANVDYGSASANFGNIGPFSIRIDGVDWNVAQLTVLNGDRRNFAFSFDMAVGAKELSLFAIPFPVDPFVDTFDVRVGANKVPLGTLTVESNSSAFFMPKGLERRIPAEVHHQNIKWEFDGTAFSGEMFVVDLAYTPRGTKVTLGYIGTFLSPIKSEEDWEASARTSIPLPN